GLAYLTLSRTALARGSLTEAEQSSREALASFAAMPPMQLGVFRQLTKVLLAQGRLPEALATAQQGMMQLYALEGLGFKGLSLRLGFIEAHKAALGLDGAASELRAALSILEGRAAAIPDPQWRRSYLENVAENARLRMLNREQLEASPDFRREKS